MPVTTRTYSTGNNWTFATFFNMLQTAFQDAGLFPAAYGQGGISNWTGNGGTTLSGQANREYIINQTSSAITGQSGTRWYIARNATGAISTLACLNRGTGFNGHMNSVGATYSQTGTTVTVTWPLHGLPVGRRVWLDFTSGTATDALATVASVVNANTFTVTLATSATTSGSVNLFSCAGTGSRSGSVMTVTVNNHGLVNGERIYAGHFNGISNTLDGYYTVTVVDANTITYTTASSGATSGNVWIAPNIRIKGSDIGGVDGTDDYWIRVDRSYGAGLANNTWLHSNLATPYAIWENIIDANKQLGRSLYSFAINGNNLVIQSGYCFDFGGNTWFGSQVPQLGGPRNLGVTAASNIHVITFCNGATNSVTLRTYQSQFDPKFVVFQFSQAGTDYNSFVLHAFQPISAAPFDLDQVSQSGVTRFINNSDFIDVTTGGISNFPLFSYEAKYTLGFLPSFGSSSRLYYPIYPSSVEVGSNKIWGPSTFPSTANFGPLINKVPLNPAAIPAFYIMPDDFGYISTIGAAPRAGDTITASANEVYTVINYASTSTSSMAFVARTV